MGILQTVVVNNNKLVWVCVLFLIGWVQLVQSQDEDKFEHGQPSKSFGIIQNDFFCTNPGKGEKSSQCSRMNENYLKFYFSVFITIAWGGAVRTIIKTFELSIPYTVVLLITGLVVGLGSRINVEFCEKWSMYTKFARTPPELILYIFLPVLIFESAFSMKAHIFMRSFLSILTVALPGMLMTTFITAISCRQFMDTYGWTFSQASLFGAIISATDPVAVVAILRELGTSESLSVMIEGESLLNDGVAILLYEIFKEVVETPNNDEDQTLKVTWMFVRIAVGGPTFGFLMGKISIWCLSMVFNDAATEITITLVSAYLTYFVGEFYLSVSGVMAVVLLGVTISAESTCISPEVEHTVHQFWQMMSFLANTVLFVVLGIVISETAINSFEVRDGYNVIWLYFALNIIRLLMLILASPILSRIGYDTTWRNLTVMMWGGLRGAVGICLALEVYRNKKLCKMDNLGPKFLLQTAGIVILTLIVNGTTTKTLLDYLGVTTISIGKLQDMANAVRTITSARVRTIVALKHDRFLADANWEVVHRFTHLKDPYAKKHKAHTDRARKLMELKLQRLRHAPAILNEKLITLGHLSSAYLHDSHDNVQHPKSSPGTPGGGGNVQQNNEDKPTITLRPGASMMVIHQGTVKGKGHPLIDIEQQRLDEEDRDSVKIVDLESTSKDYKAIMEESRGRILKAMKISCWRQYERGALTEEAVKLLVGAIEEKEDILLSMIHVEDLSQYWEIKGIFPWIKSKIIVFMADDTYPPKPDARWRHPAYWLTTQTWFHVLIYCIIFLNLGPIIYELYLIIKDETAKEGTPAKTFLNSCTFSFTSLYLLEFILKIIGRGWGDYFSSKWNILDFLVLLFSIVEVIMLTDITNSANDAVAVQWLKYLRFFRFVRLLRWARPLFPLINRFLDIRINARLFMGYDVGKGYIQAVEDALRFLPQMIENPKIGRKFKSVLDADRLKTVMELGLLQAEHPGVVVAVKTRHASRSISNQMREDLEYLKEDGLLEGKEYDLLNAKIEGNLKKLWASPASIKPVPGEEMLRNIPWVVGREAILTFIQEYKDQRIFEAGDVIYKIGDPPNGIHLIISGMAKLTFEPTDEIVTQKLEHGILPITEYLLDLSFTSTAHDLLGIGSIIGELGVLTKQPRAASITCETTVELYHWNQTVIEKGMHMFNDPYDSLESRLWRSYGIKLAAEFLHTQSAYSSWTGDRIRAHLEQGVVPVGEKYNILEIPAIISEAVLIYGQVMNQHNGEVLQAPALLPPTWNKIGPKDGGNTLPRVLLLADEEGIQEMQEKTSMSSIHKCILQSPGVAMGIEDEEIDNEELLSKAGRNRRRSVFVQNIALSIRRRSTVDALNAIAKAEAVSEQPAGGGGGGGGGPSNEV